MTQNFRQKKKEDSELETQICLQLNLSSNEISPTIYIYISTLQYTNYREGRRKQIKPLRILTPFHTQNKSERQVKK